MLQAALDMRINLEEEWTNLARKPKNITKTFLFPKWSAWNQLNKNTFIELCGEEMRKYSYEIS
jgi:hypothetical protein